MSEILKLTLDNDVVKKYNNKYFFEHPRAKKEPITKPYHPSINTWMILPRIQMNALKQKWKDFVGFWVKLKSLRKTDRTFANNGSWIVLLKSAIWIFEGSV